MYHGNLDDVDRVFTAIMQMAAADNGKQRDNGIGTAFKLSEAGEAKAKRYIGFIVRHARDAFTAYRGCPSG
ncbi:hypothetical protein AM571_CH01048 [Rhizobium etli 8C-3]|uniref:Uncharacterized protein n=1 Tax=Rhizobium etli 8C-3 TaxID=538025 RepID=A0A1L5P179_RHIET|nr:hypothetical protein AM571_CH01048 [Rhizobium etli 8C-3]